MSSIWLVGMEMAPPIFLAFAITAFLALGYTIWPRPIRFPDILPAVPRIATIPFSDPWQSPTKWALQEASTVGLPLFTGGHLVPYNIPLGADGLPFTWPAGKGSHVQKIQVDCDEYIIKVFDLWDHSPERQAAEHVENLCREIPTLAKHFGLMHFASAALPVPEPDGTAPSRDFVVMRFEKLMLSEFVSNCLKKPNPEHPLRRFARNFRLLVEQLHQAGYIHGDYSSENIAVRNEQPVLIDLDSFGLYTHPHAALALGGLGGFQPPARIQNPASFGAFPERIDYFSEWIIYCSLMAYAILGEECGPVDPDNQRMLFKAEDFDGPSFGGVDSAFDLLETSRHPLLVTLGRQIRHACTPELRADQLKPLEALFPSQHYAKWESDSTPATRQVMRSMNRG